MNGPTLDDLLQRIPGTWKQVADACNISSRALFNLRRGDVGSIRRSTLHCLSQALGIPQNEIRDAILRSRGTTSSSSSRP